MTSAPTREELLQRVRELEEECSKRKEVEESLHLTEEFTNVVFNSLSANIAVLEKTGVIIATNESWRRYAEENGMTTNPDCIGINYLDICDATEGEDAEKAQEISAGIRRVIAGELVEFTTHYPCHSPEKKSWYYLRATRLSGSGPLRVVMSHEDVTAIKLAEEALKERELELELQSQKLEETNTALRVLLKAREEDKRELEEKVLANVKELVTPYLSNLKKAGLDTRQRAYLEIVESNLNDIISPFLHNISSKYLNLTPREIQVATLVKEGKATKEIAEILNLSRNAVDFHRKNIRGKLGLKNKKANLRSHLLSLG
jgi:DNA-binding CsgD family transcriptional regulator